MLLHLRAGSFFFGLIIATPGEAQKRCQLEAQAYLTSAAPNESVAEESLLRCLQPATVPVGTPFKFSPFVPGPQFGDKVFVPPDIFSTLDSNSQVLVTE